MKCKQIFKIRDSKIDFEKLDKDILLMWIGNSDCEAIDKKKAKQIISVMANFFEIKQQKD